MRAINHALTGAVIGLSVADPVVAVPAAFLSHFVLDAIPHFALKPGEEMLDRWFKILLVIEAILCVVVVGVLAVIRPVHWLTASLCAFVAVAPDLMHIPRFIESQRTHKVRPNQTWFEKFHGLEGIQWFQRPSGVVVEAAWLVAMLILLHAWLYPTL